MNPTSLLSFFWLLVSASAFAPASFKPRAASSPLSAYPDVLVVGPSMLQLVVAKHLSQASDYTPMVVAPQKTIESYGKLVNDPSGRILKDALIGLPEEADGMVPGARDLCVCARARGGSEGGPAV